MTIDELCKLEFEQYEIVDSKVDIDKEYWSSSDMIFTDGEIKSNINREGYIHITSVKDANYVMFADRDNIPYICVYKYIYDNMFKEIIDKANILKERILKISGVETSAEDTKPDDKPISDLVDINNFRCTECGYDGKFSYKRTESNIDALETKCPKCNAIFTFVPSKYYKLASKKVVFFKTDQSSRNIDLEEQQKITKNSKVQHPTKSNK